MVSIARARRVGALLAVLFALVAFGPGGWIATAASPVPSPAASLTPPEAMCASAADLMLYVRFTREQSLGQDGLVPILVGTAASIAEAERLAGLVTDVYRPLVDDLRSSLQALAEAVRGIREQGTAGAAITAVGDALVRVGQAMDALGVQLRDRCPSAIPGASPSPLMSPAPSSMG